MKKIIYLVAVMLAFFLLTGCQVVSYQTPYDIAVKNGFEGSETEWLESLKGEKGDSLNIRDIYEEYKKEGFKGSFSEFLTTVFANSEYIEGESAYQIAKRHGFLGSEEEWLLSLKGETGAAGADGTPGSKIDLYSVYQKLYELNLYTGSYYDFALEYLDGFTIGDSNMANTFLNKVLRIMALDTDYFSRLSEYDDEELPDVSGSAGSGVIYRINKTEGEMYFITNYHVIYNEDKKTEYPYVYCFAYGSERSENAILAEYIGGTAQYDIAIFRVRDNDFIKNSTLEAAEFADSDKVIVGSEAYAVGNPDGRGIAITKGLISVDSETIELSKTKEGLNTNTNGLVQTRVIRTDAPINHGNSGGGLFDYEGKLLGIVNARAGSTDIDDIGYAIPANVVKSVVYNLEANCLGKENKNMERCLIGITVLNNSSSAYLDEDGITRIKEEVLVHEITETSIAKGYLQIDDQIICAEFKGQVIEVYRSFTLVDLCLSAQVGDHIKITVLRDGVEFTYDLVFNSSVTVY